MEARQRSSRRRAGDVVGNFGAWIATAIASLVYVAVSSRVFGPDVVGGYAAAVLAETLAWLAVGSGLAAGIQRIDRSDRAAEGAHLGRAILAGVVAAAVLLAAAGPWADLWGSPGAESLTRAFAVVALMHPLAQVLLGILRVRERQRTAASVTAIAGIAASAIGLVPVLLTREPVSLVVSNALAVALTAAFASAAGGWSRPGFPRRLAEDRFASSSVLLNLANYVIYGSMAWSVSRFISVSTFGLYSRTWLLADLPAQGAASSTVQALFPAMARSGEEEGRESTTDAVVVTAAASGLLLGKIAALSSLIVPVLLGDAWLDAIPLLAVLGISLTAMPPQWVLAARLQARGRFAQLATSRAIGLLLAAASVVAVASSGEPLLAAGLAGLLQLALLSADLRSASRAGMIDGRTAAGSLLAIAAALVPLWAVAAVQAAGLVEPRGAGELAVLCLAVAVAALVSAAVILRGPIGGILAGRGILPDRLVGIAGRRAGRTA